MAQADVLVGCEAGIVTLTMNRPERRNALSLAMMRTLTAAFREWASRQETRIFILSGEGPAFSAGHDLRELHDCSEEAAREIFAACTELMQTIQGVSQPVIAQVDGIATAAGCQLAASCDLAVASERATFATPGVRIGLFCSTPAVALVRNIGRKRALEMLFTGDAIDADTAAAWGLVNAVVSHDALHDHVLKLAAHIARAAAATLAIGKRAFYETIDAPQDTAYRRAAEAMTTNALSEDASEGIGGFLSRRLSVSIHAKD